MKFIYFIALSAAVFFNSNIYALDAGHAKVVSYKEWVTGHIQGNMKTIPRQVKARNVNPLKALQTDPGTNAIVTITDHLNPEEINANNTINMNGHLDVRLDNYQPMLHRYTITTELCLYEQSEGYEPSCYNVEEVLQLAPNSTVYTERQPSVSYVMPKQGYYVAILRTTVKRDDLSTAFVSGDSRQFEASIPDEG